MSPEEYKNLREKVGTQPRVADLLGVSRATIAGREEGTLRITAEAKYGLSYIAQRVAAGNSTSKKLWGNSEAMWSQIDWSMRTGEIAKMTGRSSVSVSNARRRHAPETVQKRGRPRKGDTSPHP